MNRREFVRRTGGAALWAPLLGPGPAAGQGGPAAAAGSGGGAGAPSPGPLSLFLAGDVMTGRGIDQILPRSVDATLHERWVKDARAYVRIAEEAGADIPGEAAYDYVWGDALAELERADPDHRVVNLETAVTTRDERWPGKGVHYRMHPDNTPVLTEAGLDAVILGNNHVLDWGREGLLETLRTLDDAGVAAAGAGVDDEAATRPVALSSPRGRLLLFSLASPTAGVPPEWAAGSDRPGVALVPELSASTAQELARAVGRWREPGDRVVVSVHWGGNWGYAIPAEQRVFARALVEAGGADLVFGHSSHHPKGMEVHQGRLIVYGAGDLLNDYEGIGGHEEYRSHLSLMYLPTLAEDGTLRELVLVPMRIRDFRLQRASDEEAEWLRETLDRECRELGTGVAGGEGGRLKLTW